MKTSLIVLVSLAALLSTTTRALASVIDLNEVSLFDRQAYVGSNVEFECELKTYYDSPISWRKLVGRMSDESEEFDDGRLIIYDVSKEDAGEYECYNPANGDKRRMRLVVLSHLSNIQHTSSAENNGGNVGSLKEIQSKYKQNVEAQVGGSTELYCEFKDEPEVEWKKVDGEIGPHKTIYGAPDNRLALHFLTEEDEGVYECILPDGTTSQINLKISTKKTGVNDDVFKTNTEDYSDYNHENVQTINADVGSDVKLVCTLPEYNNGGEINWRKVAGVIGDNSQINENRLEIEEVSQDDSGIYECSSENLSSMKFHLIVNSQPSTTTRATTTNEDEEEEDFTTAPTTTETEILDDPVDSFVTKPIGSKVELVCALKLPSYDIEWIKLDDEINYDKATAYENKLIIDNLDQNDAGVYQCNSLETRSAHRTRLEVIRSSYPSSSNGTVLQTDYRRNQNQYCREDEATCRNGQCIPKSVLCDGRNDCADGSDENNCGLSGSGYIGKCQPNEKPCRSDGKCIPKFWFCDGERECSDGTDEESCTGPSPGGICRPFEFMCKNRNQCIYKSFMCDNERDCTDGSDETGCVEPKVVQPPIRMLTVCLGATFKLECRANGFPVPFINWRLNWGHVCPEPRCWMVTDEIGHGTLTVTNAQWEDAGAYSCEAINSKGREFAIPDAIVRIEPCQTTTTTTTTTTTRTTTPLEMEEECECYGHAEACTCSNECYRCQHNTTGRHCEECLPGYYRDRSRPNDLWAYCYQEYYIPPETTTTRRIITTTPMLIIDEEDCVVHCHNHSECTCNMQCYECKDNTWGDRCEKCRPGFVGDATRGTPYDCVPEDQANYYRNPNRLQALVATTRAQSLNVECNQFGTAQIIDGNCKCKPGVVGAFCDQCAPKFFHLVEKKAHKRGCISCFCNGLEVDCESSSSKYKKLNAKFDEPESQWLISDRFTETKIELESIDQGVEFARFNEFSEIDMYILVPSKFLGNKLGSYGGNLTFDLTVKSQSESSSEPKTVEIRISGAQVNIVHKSETPIKVNEKTTITINLVEDSFKRYGDNGRVDRDHLMIALSDIRIIMIRASYVENQESIRLSDFSLDLASESSDETTPEDEENSQEGADARAVEICRCPPGYKGHSCELCAPGYVRSKRGFYLGLCEPEE